MHARAYHSPREAYIYASSTMRTLALLIAYPYDDRCFSLREGLPKRLPLTARVIIDTVRKVNNIHTHSPKCIQLDFPYKTILLESSTFTRATVNTPNMASRRVLTVDEVMQELQNSNSEGEMSENDDSEDDFEGYLEETEVEQWSSRREMESSRDEEGDESEGDQSSGEEEMEDDVPSIPPYTLTSGCSASLPGNRPIDYFSMFVDESMLQHIVDQTILNSEQFMESHTLAPHSRIRQWSKEEHTIAELRRFLALILVMGIVRYPQIESHWSTSWPYATDTFSSVSYIRYKIVRTRIETVLFLTGYETRSILPTDEISPPE